MKTRSLASRATLCVALAACSSQHAEPESSTSSAITMPACGTPLADVDGVYAYSNGPDEGSGASCGGATSLGTLLYQCVEFAQRYMNERFGIQPVWPVSYAAQMCGIHPSGTTAHWVGDGYMPKHGDLAVWTAGYDGHVAVVRTAQSDGIEIVEQNGGWSTNGTRFLAGSPSSGWSNVACFVSADANTGGGAPASSGTCGGGDGLYCGGNGGGTDPKTLYRCSGGRVTVAQACATGCEWLPFPQNDRCRTSASCPNGNGRYCGGDGISGDPGVLFECRSGTISAVQRCTNGCQAQAAGFDDVCR